MLRKKGKNRRVKEKKSIEQKGMDGQSSKSFTT